ncbi:MAG: hypothetical protein WB676_19745 [Bryobacteraceae bacterium]
MTLRDAQKVAKTVAPNAQKFAKHVVPHVVKPARIIWNQVIGFVFLVLGLMFLRPAIQRYRLIGIEEGSLLWFCVATALAALMIGFAVHAFLRARRISRS